MKTRAFDPIENRWRTDYVMLANGVIMGLQWIDMEHVRYPFFKEVNWKLSRFTGHLDIEKNEIYENHIVKLASGSVGVVKFYNGSFVVDIRKRSGTFEFYEWPSEYFAKYDFDDGFVPGALIIGDVFTTPELLEEVK